MERLDRFMARVNAAYYATHDPFRDFATSPEISQVFGELIGAWAAVTWQAMGAPRPVLLVELGPGRGTLMRDALRAIRSVAPAFGEALALHLVETSPRLRALQDDLAPVAWHESVATLPEGAAIVLGNEFLDALPIRQFVREGEGWGERFVDSGAPVTVRSAEGPPVTARGDVVEWGEMAQQVVGALARRVAGQGGAALFVDYGAEGSGTDTLQAIRAGRPADPFAAAGEADLTAHVDFGRLAETARAAGASVQGPVPQGVFLTRLGLFQRTDRLARGGDPQRASALVAAASRLAEPMHMGRLFRAMAVTHPGLPALAGFAA